MHKNAMKCNETLSKWCKNKHGASKIMDTLETYQSPPPAHSEELSLDKKRKGVEELFSSSTSAPKNVAGEASALEDEVEIFDLLDS
jgi:hypothetical protein